MLAGIVVYNSNLWKLSTVLELCALRWASQEVKSGASEDPRLELRLVRMMEQLSLRPNSPPPEACPDRAGLVAAYRLWNNPRISPREMLTGHVEQTVRRAGDYPVVLAVQDTAL